MYYLLQEDAQMTNVVCASDDFALEAIELEMSGAAAFACSDGLYNAFKTHDEFESFMLSALLGKSCEQSFEAIINERRNDDVSFALAWFDPEFQAEPYLERLEAITADQENGELSLSPLVPKIAGFDFLYSDALGRLESEELKLGGAVEGLRNPTFRRLSRKFFRSFRKVATNEFLPLASLFVLLGVAYLAYDIRSQVIAADTAKSEEIQLEELSFFERIRNMFLRED